MISLKYKFHVLKRKIADFFEPSKFFLATSSSKSHSFVIWIVMFYLTIFWVRENSIFLFEQRNLVNIKRWIICWVFYNQLLDWRFLFVGYCPGAFSFTNSNITFKSIGDQKSSWVMNLKENSCKNHESLGKNGRNHEYQDSNDSSSAPDLVREGRMTQALVVQKLDNYAQRIP